MPQFPETKPIGFDFDWLRRTSGFPDDTKDGQASISQSVSIRGWEPDEELLKQFEEGVASGYLSGNR